MGVKFRVGNAIASVLLVPGDRLVGLELLEDGQGRARLVFPTEKRQGAHLQGEGGGILWIGRPLTFACSA